MIRAKILAIGERVLWPALTAAVLILIWHFLVKWSGSKVFPSPVDVWKGLAELSSKGVLWRHIGGSLRRVLFGYGLGVLLGVPLGLALGWYGNVGQVVNPVIQMLRPISPIAWIPVAIVWFGVGDAAAVYLIFLASFLPIVIASMNAVRNVPAMYSRGGQNFGLAPTQLLARVIFPASIPQIIIGLRISLGIAWLVVVAAEMIAVDSGLGYVIIDARNSGKRYDLVVAGMLVIGVIGLILDIAFRQVETLKSVRWGVRLAG